MNVARDIEVEALALVMQRARELKAARKRLRDAAEAWQIAAGAAAALGYDVGREDSAA